MDMKRRLLFTGSLSLLVSLTSFSQNKTIVVVGSSTAEGFGVSADSSFAGRLASAFSKNKNDGIDTNVIVLAVAGYTTYKAMPDDFIMPPNRSDVSIDKSKNITKALSYSPDIVIINFPSNDQDPKYGYSVKETMTNLRIMNDRVIQTGAKCFITTSQPRDEYSMSVKKQLKRLADSVENAFGAYALDLWDVLADSDYNRKSELRGSDQIHLNNLGHALIFDIIMEKDIFAPQAALPVILTAFSARSGNQVVDLNWRVELEENYTFYEVQRSANGTEFNTVSRIEGVAGIDQRMNYSWTDLSPLNGKNFYRLKIVEPDGIRYSYIVSGTAGNSQAAMAIGKAYINRSELVIEMENVEMQAVSLYVFGPSGQLLREGQYQLDNQARVRVPFGNTLPGVYIIQVYTSDGRSYVKQLMKGY